MRWKHKLVYVEWVDASQPVPEWHFFSEIEAGVPVPCRSVGWVHTYNKDILMILPAVTGMDTEHRSGMGSMTIPRSAIRSITAIEIEENYNGNT